MSETKLEPCPLCVSPHVDFARDMHGEPKWMFCKGCGCQAPIAAWNRRAADRDAMIESCEKIVNDTCDELVDCSPQFLANLIVERLGSLKSTTEDNHDN